jgi:uncharacterized membrane protein (DUF106 family)
VQIEDIREISRLSLNLERFIRLHPGKPRDWEEAFELGYHVFYLRDKLFDLDTDEDIYQEIDDVIQEFHKKIAVVYGGITSGLFALQLTKNQEEIRNINIEDINRCWTINKTEVELVRKELLSIEDKIISLYKKSNDEMLRSINARYSSKNYMDQLGGYIFIKINDTWKISYESEVFEGLKHERGMYLIAELLRRPNDSKGWLPPVPHELLDKSVKHTEDDQINGGEFVDDIMDDEGIRAYKKRIDDIRLEIEEAENEKDTAKILKLQNEEENILQYLKECFGKFQTKRKAISSTKSKIADTAMKAVHRAIKHLRDKGLSKLPDHLKKYISSNSGYLFYRPGPKPPPWQLR